MVRLPVSGEPSGNAAFKHELFAQFARIGKAVSHGNRLELLEHLAQGERSVDALARATGMSIANTSQHLQHLRNAGLLTSRKVGLNVFYRLSGDDVLSLVEGIRDVARRRLADVDRLIDSYLNTKDDLEPVPVDELLDRARKGEVTVLDVRPEEEFDAGHLPDAVNIPLPELEQRLNVLDADREIIAYCRGPHCVLAYDAVARLRKQGRSARRLDAGFPEWRRAGFPVETTDRS